MEISRRDILRWAGVGALGACTPSYARSVSKPEDDAVEAVVVGSGFGGGIVAWRLGEAGIGTVVLERGLRWPKHEADTFARCTQPDERTVWMNEDPNVKRADGRVIQRYAGIIETIRNAGSVFKLGACVGGGSLHYKAITIQPQERFFRRIFGPHVDYEEMATVYYPRALANVRPAPSPTPPDILALDYNEATRVFIDQVTRAGLNYTLPRLAIDWAVMHSELAGKLPRRAVECDTGFNDNDSAKHTVDKTYIPWAERTGKVTVLPLHVVTEVHEIPDHGYRVICDEIDSSGFKLRTKSFACKYLFLCAGAIGTTGLLLKCKTSGTLARLNDEVGRSFSGNGNHIVMRASNTPTIDASLGVPSGVFVEHFDNDETPIAMENINVSRPIKGSFAVFHVGIPRELGEIRYDPATKKVLPSMPPDEAVYRASMKLHTMIDERNGVKSPLHDPEGFARVVGHVLGGAAIGKVCDPYGHVLNYSNLFVMDSAAVPGAIGCANPFLTLVALAERNVEAFLKKRT